MTNYVMYDYGYVCSLQVISTDTSIGNMLRKLLHQKYAVEEGCCILKARGTLKPDSKRMIIRVLSCRYIGSVKYLFIFEKCFDRAVAYTIGSIFKHIIDCVQLYFTNGFTNIVL